MSEKMSEREIFLSDVIITAVEGGIQYWACIHGCYSHGDFDDERTPAKATLLALDTSEVLPLNNDVVAKAFKAVLGHDEIPGADKNWRKRMVAAYWDVEDGVCDIDADDADALVQIGLFGEVRYC